MTPNEEWEELGRQFDRLGDELREFWGRSERSADDLRAFNQSYLLRMDRIHQRSTEVAIAMRAEIQVAHEENMRRFDEEAAENRAQREALFRILDKLDGRDDEAA